MTLKEFREVANSPVTDYHYYLESETGDTMNIIIFNSEDNDIENITNIRFLDCIADNYKVINVGATYNTIHVMCEKISQ